MVITLKGIKVSNIKKDTNVQKKKGSIKQFFHVVTGCEFQI